LLGVDNQPIMQLRNELSNIDITSLDKSNIAEAIQKERLSVIELFLNSTE
jgi:hypothetical protein